MKECAALREQFLPYFVEGYSIGDSVLAGPASGFVRAHVLNDKMLIFVLNDGNEARKIKIDSDLELWLPKASSYEVKYYASPGKPVKTSEVQTVKWSGITESQEPEELAVYEIYAMR